MLGMKSASLLFYQSSANSATRRPCRFAHRISASSTLIEPPVEIGNNSSNTSPLLAHVAENCVALRYLGETFFKLTAAICIRLIAWALFIYVAPVIVV